MAILEIFQRRCRRGRGKQTQPSPGLQCGSILAMRSKTMKVPSRIGNLPIAAIVLMLQTRSTRSCLWAPSLLWCASTWAAYLYLPQGRPRQPFQTAQGFLIQALRLTDQRARSGTPFRLFGTASVDSQSLTDIPRLQNLRLDPKFAARSAVWPFETGWATKANWLPKSVSILHAEIYPSVRAPKADSIKDRGQVRSIWEWAKILRPSARRGPLQRLWKPLHGLFSMQSRKTATWHRLAAITPSSSPQVGQAEGLGTGEGKKESAMKA